MTSLELVLQVAGNRLLLGVVDLVKILGFSERTIRCRVARKTFEIPFTKVGGTLVWRAQDVAAFLDGLAAKQPKKDADNVNIVEKNRLPCAALVRPRAKVERLPAQKRGGRHE